MNKQLDEKLVKAFPLLYRERHYPMGKSSMHWGFTCGDGWFKLVWNLSCILEGILKRMPKNQQKNYCAAQVKEKFGTLRFYVHGRDEGMMAAIHAAENESACICEECGTREDVKLRKHLEVWLVTCCSKCFEAMKQKALAK